MMNHIQVSGTERQLTIRLSGRLHVPHLNAFRSEGLS
jgi:hypothetical protein